MREYEINYDPVPWKAHAGYGKKSFNPRFKEKEAYQWQLKVQHGGDPLFTGTIRTDIFFEMPIPKSFPKRLLKKVERGERVWHTKRPDRDNLQKFLSDTLIGTILADDALVCSGETQKFYSKTPRTRIFIQELE